MPLFLEISFWHSNLESESADSFMTWLVVLIWRISAAYALTFAFQLDKASPSLSEKVEDKLMDHISYVYVTVLLN